MGRSRDYHHHHHHISKNPEMVRFCLQPMVIQSHYKPTTQNILPLQNFDTSSKHGESSPVTVIEYCPQANGLVEPFNKILFKFIHTSLPEGRNWMVMKPIIHLKMIQNVNQHLPTTPNRSTVKKIYQTQKTTRFLSTHLEYLMNKISQ